MRKIAAKQISDAVKDMCIQAAHILPADILAAFKTAAKTEKGLAQKILKLCVQNAHIAKTQSIPLCQDTGTAVIFADIGQDVCVAGNITDAITLGVKQGYKDGYLRKSTVKEPLFNRKNTQDNLPAVIHYNFVKGSKIKLKLLLKGGGAENTSRIRFFTPADTPKDIEDFVLQTAALAGAKACPPFVIGIGIGGNFETCAKAAKFALTRKIGAHNKNKDYAALEDKILKSINKLNIGPQGLGGKTTALAVNIEFLPCHMASLPVAINIGCHSSRHISRII